MRDFPLFTIHYSLLNRFQLGYCSFVLDVARVERGDRLEEHDVGFFFGNGAMLQPSRDDDELTLLDPLAVVLVLHPEAPFHDHEHLIFMIVMVPDKWALKFHELD